MFLSGIKKLSCDCGEEVRVQCGAKTTECKKPCARVHACAHQGPEKEKNVTLHLLHTLSPSSVTHTCHNKETCPPCYALVQRTCVGGHDVSQKLQPSNNYTLLTLL